MTSLFALASCVTSPVTGRGVRWTITDSGAEATSFSLSRPIQESIAVEISIGELIRQARDRVTVPRAIDISQRWSFCTGLAATAKIGGGASAIMYSMHFLFILLTLLVVCTKQQDIFPFDILFISVFISQSGVIRFVLDVVNAVPK